MEGIEPSFRPYQSLVITILLHVEIDLVGVEPTTHGVRDRCASVAPQTEIVMTLARFELATSNLGNLRSIR